LTIQDPYLARNRKFASNGANARTPGGRLRDLLAEARPCQLMGAHDGLSARIAAAEGFPALWASGLCISTSLGVRDNNEASWTQLLGVVETMAEAVDVPVLVDGDTGHGTYSTARRFARRTERIGAAGVCFEDKTFPKMNSFFGTGHRLAPVAEFCGKIAACKDSQVDRDFVLVARTEALISGRSVAEALERAHAYAEAGADALFIHSRQSTAAEIAEFAGRWRGLPLLVAPTTYPSTTLEAFRQMGIAGLIWANHSMRAAFAAIRDTCRQVRSSGGVSEIERQVAPLADIFGLLGYHELQQDDEQYSGKRFRRRPEVSPGE
jgi:phosphoenolpyruvate phosphomutase